MKTKLTSFLILFFTIVLVNNVVAQKFSPLDKSPMDVASFPESYRVADKLVKITYSRPQLKGRPLSKLAPEGKVWRTGANEAAEIVFYKDVTLGGKEVKAGRYTFFTIPGSEEWTIILNSAENVWGAYFYEEEEDVLRVTAPVSQDEKSVEVFSIAFDGEEDADVNMYLAWGKTRIIIPIKE